MKKLTLEGFSTALPDMYAKRASLFVEQKTVREEVTAIRMRKDNPNNGTESANLVRSYLGEPLLPHQPHDEERLKELLPKLDALNKSVSALDEAIYKEKDRASRKLCEAVASDHRKAAMKFADAIINLHTTHTEYNDFLTQIEDTGATISPLNPVYPTYLGNPKDPSGPYYYFMKEFFESGHIDQKDPLGLVR